MGRRIKNNLRLSSSIAISIIVLLSLIVIAGCYDGMLDDIQQKIEEDRIEAGTAPTYSVTYEGNENTGGEVPVDLTNYKEGETVTVLGNVNNLVLAENSFIGWNTEADGTGTSYTQGPILIMGDSDVILYAQWTTNPTYTVTYNGNGETGGTVPTGSVNYEEGAWVEVLGNTGNFVRTDYNFGGWSKIQDGSGTIYAQGDTFQMAISAITLYAKWTLKPYTVTYDGNGETDGTVPVDTHHYDVGDTVTVLANTGSLVKIQDGISLLVSGWNNQADGNDTDYALGSGTFTMGASDITLYAKWTALRCTGPAGGLIFYVDEADEFSWDYLEAAPSDQSTDKLWSVIWTTLIGTTDIAIGTGQANTDAIMGQSGFTDGAAKLCDDLEIINVEVTYDDWFLPSKLELNQMYENLKVPGVGGFAADLYWSSSENSAATAWAQYFPNGTQYYRNKTNPYRVRAVRAF